MTIKEIIPIANQIIRDYDLCDSCLGRLFSKHLHLSSNKLLGKKLKMSVRQSSKKCFICKNLLDNLTPYLKLMLDASSKYDFSSMVVGALIKPSIIDRDDYIRSKYKLRGIDSVKTGITKELGKQFTKKIKKTIDFLNPDLTFTINFKDESCQLRSKPILLHGRYTKSERGLPQKQKPCVNCSGKGCRSCNFHGISEYDSVEGKISEFLFNTFPLQRGDQANIKMGLEFVGNMLDNNYSVVLFPEGRMSRSGELQSLKGGAGLLAVEMAVPIVPVLIIGANDILPYVKVIPRKLRGKVTVIFGKPLTFDKSEPYEDASRKIHDAIKALQKF